MDKYGKNTPVGVPKWDIALESLVNEEYRSLGRALHLDDFRRLGRDHKIRVHDITATIYQLERYGKWRHQGHDPEGRPLPEQALEALYTHGRLDEDTAEKYAVTWAPQ